MKWLIGVGLVATSPLIISGVILYLLVYRLPISAYELADELYSLRTEPDTMMIAAGTVAYKEKTCPKCSRNDD
jgi:hypothetical protein